MATTTILRRSVLILVLALASCERHEPASVSGTIETDEVRVASRYGGRVEKLFAREGDALKAGAPIAELDAAELGARRARLAARLAEDEAGPRKEEIATAKHDWESQSAELERARADARRAEQLFADKTIAPSEHDQALTRARSLEQSAGAARSRYELLLAGTRPERVAQTRAELAEVDAQLKEMSVAAPSDCVLEVLNVKVGDVLGQNEPIATLLLVQHLWVRVYVPEPWLGRIEVGERVRARVDGEPGKDFEGTVEQIARSAEFTPRNVQTVGERVKQVFGIKVRLDNSSGQLRAGMGADVFFPRAGTP